MLGSYSEHPTSCRFIGQNDDEKIILFIRAHPIVNLSWIIAAVLIASLTFVVPWAVDWLNLTLPQLPPTLSRGLVLINILVVSFVVIEGFLHWYYNVNFVTNTRIVDIDFEHLLSNNIDFAPLTSVEEANGRVSGILGLIFHYGDVSVQTAGTATALEFLRVSNPSRIADIINDEAAKAKKLLEGGGNAGNQPN